MTIESFLLEYGSTLFGCFAFGFGAGYFMLAFKRGIEILKSY